MYILLWSHTFPWNINNGSNSTKAEHIAIYCPSMSKYLWFCIIALEFISLQELEHLQSYKRFNAARNIVIAFYRTKCMHFMFAFFSHNENFKWEINTESLHSSTSLTQRKVILKIALSFGQESEETLRITRHFGYSAVWYKRNPSSVCP